MKPVRIWKDVVGFEGRYEVSNDGLVRSTPHVLAAARAKSGHLQVALGGKTRYVHRLVAEAFFGAAPPFKNVVHHRDRNPANNHIDNLEWCSSSDNNLHSWRMGRRHYASISVVAVTDDGELVAQYPTMAAAGRALGVTRGAVRAAILSGGRCCGFRWVVE